MEIFLMVTTTIKTQASDTPGGKCVATVSSDVDALGSAFKLDLVFNNRKQRLTIVSSQIGVYSGTHIVFPYSALRWEKSVREFIMQLISFHAEVSNVEEYFEFLLKKAGIQIFR